MCGLFLALVLLLSLYFLTNHPDLFLGLFCLFRASKGSLILFYPLCNVFIFHDLSYLADMHDLRLIHTDLKPENILLVSSEYVKLPGSKVFGLSQLKNNTI